MTDSFIDCVAHLAGRTSRALKEVARKLEENGPDPQADLLRKIATEHSKVALDCLVETQPVEIERRPPGRHLRDMAEQVRQVAAGMLRRQMLGHDLASEAAVYLDEAAELADRVIKRRS